MHPMRKVGCAGILLAAIACAGTRPASEFSRLVDDYLEEFSRHHPSIAAGNGLHAHDDRLEDFSADAIASEIAWLRSVRTKLDAIDARALTPDETVDRRILQGIVDG